MTGKVKIMLYCSKLEKVVKEEGDGGSILWPDSSGHII